LTIAFYVSAHGLGHASRDVELINEIIRQQPDLRIEVRTSAPSWVFGRVRGTGVEVQPCETDTGMVQLDSLRLDIEETARSAAAFYRDFDRRVGVEAARLRESGARLVIGDVPPLACAAAQAAGLPSVLVANFTWDWIYAYYPEFESLAPGVVDRIGAAYSSAAKALRLPISGGFESVAAVTEDVPFIARRSTSDPADTRRLLGFERGQRLVLSSFGGYGLTLPYDRIAGSGLAVIAPALPPPHGLKYEDLVAASDLVVSKPGYGIVSECVANRTPLLYASRGRFAEYEVMRTEMPRLLRCRHIETEDLLAGNWRDGVEALLAQEEPSERPRVDGASVAAAAILEILNGLS
jgi:L-arabinokinase